MPRLVKFVLKWNDIGILLGWLVLAAMLLADDRGLGHSISNSPHGIIAGLLFGIAGRVVYERTHTRDLAELQRFDLWRTLPGAAIGFTLATAASLGLPGFRAKQLEKHYFQHWTHDPADITPENAKALSALLAQAEGPVLVHCASGNRVGGLLAVAMAQNGMTTAQALDFGRSAGMKSIEGRAREVIEQEIGPDAPARCVAARDTSDPSQCPAGGRSSSGG